MTKRRLALALAAGFLSSTAVLALVPSDEELRAEPSIVFTAPEGATRAFFERYSADWDVRWDARSDRPHLIQGRGVPIVPGRGNTLLVVARREA